MARHNREGHGSDQRGMKYGVSYQPDWLRLVKVTRKLDNDRQSTKTLFRNPGRREQSPGDKVRTRITSPEQGLDFEISIADPSGVIKRIIVETTLPEKARLAASGEKEEEEELIVFTIEDRLPPPPIDDDDEEEDDEEDEEEDDEEGDDDEGDGDDDDDDGGDGDGDGDDDPPGGED